MPGHIALDMQHHYVSCGHPEHPPRLAALLGLNTPNARDGMHVQNIAIGISSIAMNFGYGRCAILACVVNLTNYDSDIGPLGAALAVVHALGKASFNPNSAATCS